MKIIILYHRTDLDGWTSGWLMRKHYEQHQVTMFGIEYGDEIPKLSGYDKIVVVDFCLPHELMSKYAGKLLWLDHHQDAINDMAALRIEGIRTTSECGATLALSWSKLMNYYAVAQLVKVYDLWKTDDEAWDTAFAFNHWAHSVGQEAYWTWLDGFKQTDLMNAVDAGENMLGVLTQYLGKLTPVVTDRLTAYPIINPILNNIPRETDLLLMFRIEGPDRVKCSIRSKEADVTSIAKSYGGGGHKHASGFHCNFEQLKILLT